ncbi:MAG: ABC transporter substrate-binding protein [Candidatus Thorarchaeota archaeon]
MSFNFKRVVLPLVFFFILIMPLSSVPYIVENSSVSTPRILAQTDQYQVYHGGSIDSMRFVEYNNLTDALDAIDSGEADLLGHRINASDYTLVDSYSSVEQEWVNDELSMLLTLNAKYYPLNNFHLRRAIAFAVDKNNISETAMNETVDPIDLAVPLYSEYSLESTEGGMFYDANVASANMELALAGMLDVDDDGVVEGPDGSEVDLPLWYPWDTPGMNVTASIISQNLLDVGINNTLLPLTSVDLQYEVAHHNLTYGLALYKQKLSQFGYDWVAMTFHSYAQTIIGHNIANIYNAQLDDLAERYLDEVYLEIAEEIGQEAMLAVRDLCPVVPLFTYRWLSVYSEQNFENWPEDKNRGVLSLWTPITVTPTGSISELIVAVLPQFFDSFFRSLNPFFGNQTIGQDWIEGMFNPYLLVYDSPIATSPDGFPVPRHATSWEMQFLGIAPDIAYNQSRVNFYCDPNANWTDGEVMNAQDYRFTFEYYSNNSLTEYEHLGDTVKVTGDYLAGILDEYKDMFLYRRIGELPILPEHIWTGQDSDTWDPTLSQAIGSGPFQFSQFTPGSELVLTANDDYYPEIDNEAPTLRSLSIIPEEPIPAESVVFRVFIDDRSLVNNVTIIYTYQVGQINFTDSQMMISDATGFQATVPARVTATTVSWRIEATDIWGNRAVVASGSYSRSITTDVDGFESTLLLALEISGVALVVLIAIILIRRRRK